MSSRVMVALAATAALAFVLVVFALGPASPPLVTPSPSPTSSPTGSPSPTATASPTATPTPAAAGEISGDLAYPSEFIPALTVYAISTTDADVWFSVDTPQYPLATNTPPQPTYTLGGVAPGTYYVLAYFQDETQPGSDRPGVYSEFVRCGLRAGCTDHSLVPVTVGPSESVSDIDVTDWYYPPDQTYPPRPE